MDKDDNVYVFNRGPYNAVMIFDKSGDYLNGWGRIGHDFIVPHGLSVGPDGLIYTSDTGDHTVRCWDGHGRLILTIGQPLVNSPIQSGKPFNKTIHDCVYTIKLGDENIIQVTRQQDTSTRCRQIMLTAETINNFESKLCMLQYCLA